MPTKKEEIARVRRRLLQVSKGDKQMQSVIKEFNFSKVKKSKLEKVR